MSDLDSSGPRRARRALPPTDDVDFDEIEDAPAPRRGARFAAPTEEAADYVPSRALGAVNTPVPPPPPVLPPTETTASRHGRRFSAADVPDDFESPLPRRSALSPSWVSAGSPTSPASPGEPISDTAAPETPDASATESLLEGAPESDRISDQSLASSSITTDAPAERTTRRKRGWIFALVGVLVVALVGTGIWFVVQGSTLGPFGATPKPTHTPAEPATLLASTADLAGMVKDASWQEADTVVDKQPETAALCLKASGQTTPAAATTYQRTLTSDNRVTLHQIDLYGSPDEAKAAYAQRLDQLATCPTAVVLITDAQTVKGLGDDGFAQSIDVQSATATHNSIVVSQSGSTINILAVSDSKATPATQAVSAALAKSLTRQCTEFGSTCPTTPALTVAVPGPVEPAGWLASVDLPRLTAGTGQWVGTDVTDPKIPGSLCEGVDLVKGTGATEVKQRTYLMTDDAKAPTDFGLDAAVYTFKSAADAKAFSDKVGKSTGECAKRVTTATVKGLPAPAVTGASGSSWAITQKVSETQQVLYRTTVASQGSTVIYLVTNPSASYNFSDAQWKALSERAVQRLSQG